MIQNIAVGIAALLLATLEALCAIALGEVVTRKVRDAELRLASSLIAGFAVKSFVIAAAAWGLSTKAAIIVDVLLSAAVLLLNRRGLLSLLADVKREVAALELPRWPKAFLAVSAALFWLDAIAPPRDGDVVRYHLAHIAQIVRDGAWQGIADYHYALPFGWTFNYLTFQALGIPQAAHMLNALVVCVMALLALSLARRASSSRAVAAVALLFVLHPAVLKAGTTAFADAYGMLVVFVATMLVTELSDDNSSLQISFLAGLMSWIGIQSRYHLIGFGIAATMGFLFCRRAPGGFFRGAASFGVGALAALILASPFYLMNLHQFGNPVWPFFVHGAPNEPYVNIVAAAYQRSQTGPLTISELSYGVKRLVTFRDMFPIPIAVFLGLVWGWIRYRSTLRVPLLITTLFAILWMLAQPVLYARFVLYFLPLVIILWIGIIAGFSTGRKSRWLVPAIGIAAVAMFFADLAYSADNLRYVITRDAARFHRYTWYYPVYRWVNANTSRDARFVVVVWSGYSYYLDRRYRRADPWLAGEIDWERIDKATDLEKLLAERGIDFLIYDDRSWGGLHGGEKMMNAVHEAMRTGALVPVRKFHERLYTSRINGSYRESDVYVLRVNRRGTTIAAGG